MASKQFTVLNLLDYEAIGQEDLCLKCLAGRKGLSREITVADINRPGLALSGFYEEFPYQSIQVIGRSEAAYLNKLELDSHTEAIDRLMEYDIPCLVFSCDIAPSEIVLQKADEKGCAVLQTSLETMEFCRRIIRLFQNIFVLKKTMHGVFVEIYGVGILLTGTSGVGKSECALELVERGHRLVADDIVEIRCINGTTIVGQGANKLISHHMEIRGLGIINVTQLYGVGSVRDQKEVQLIIRLEEWNSSKLYDRIGTAQETVELLGVKIPMLEIPVKIGRNLPIIIEAAAMNARLKTMGYDSARDFSQNVLKWIESGSAKNNYNGNEDVY